MIPVKVSLSDFIKNIIRWNSLYSWDFSGPWKKDDAVIWGVGNSIIPAVRATDSIIEIDFIPFRNLRPDQDACFCWNWLLRKCQAMGWITDFSASQFIEKTELEADWDRATAEYIDSSENYEAKWKAERQVEVTPWGIDEASIEREVKQLWEQHIYKLKIEIEKRNYWAARANLTAEQAAKEFFERLEISISNMRNIQPSRADSTNPTEQVDSVFKEPTSTIHRKKRGEPWADTMHKIENLRELRKEAMSERHVIPPRLKTCKFIPIDPKTVKKHDPELWERWEDKDY